MSVSYQYVRRRVRTPCVSRSAVVIDFERALGDSEKREVMVMVEVR